MIILGSGVGFGFPISMGAILAGMALIVTFGYAFSWIYSTIGPATKDPEPAQVAGIMPFHPHVRQ